MASEEDDEVYDEDEEELDEDEELEEPDEDFDDDGAFLDDEGDDDDDSLLEAPTDVSIRRRSGKKGLVVEGEPKAKLEKAEVAKQVWDRLTKKFDGVSAEHYSMQGSFQVDDVVSHPKFGRGYVIEVPGKDKIEVLFEEGLKRLVHEK
jgi:hypothetical protein